MARRQGTTLIEVLVAIFVMGIGLIALLTLFPLGALRMAQAIQDDRCATAVVNAGAIATMKNIRNDPGVRTPPGFANGVDIFKDAVPGRNFAADPDGPSYPVYVDPIGYISLPRINQLGTGQDQQKWVAEATGGNYVVPGLIARCPTSFTAPINVTPLGKPNIYKWFALLDDYLFDSEEVSGGQVSNFNPAPPPYVLRRDIRYTWAYLVQRPRSSDPSIATCSVVVYKQRPLSLSAGHGNFKLPEAAYKAIFNLNSNSITLDWSTASFPPSLNAGDWLLDTTFVSTTRPGPGNRPATYGSAHGYFYRVVGVTSPSILSPTLGPKSADYEVQQPIRGFPPGTAQASGGVIVLEGVADVYDRGLDRKFD